MKTTFCRIIAAFICLTSFYSIKAQNVSFPGIMNTEQRNARSLLRLNPYMPYDRFLELDSIARDSAGYLLDSMSVDISALHISDSTGLPIINMTDSTVTEVFIPRHHKQLPSGMYRTVVFDTYHFLDTLPIVPEYHGAEAGSAFDWLDDLNFASDLLWQARQQYMIENPDEVIYNEAWLPEPPKHYKALVDPVTTRIVLTETTLAPKPEEAPNLDYGKRHWLKSFQGSVQFSQAYVSPNWYQGGNNNVNMIASGVYNVRLNEKYHPNLLFETNIAYKLGLNNAPNDTIHDYNISEDLFQVNSKFGLKAFKNWYYSVALMFKTQLLHNYPVNSNDLKAAFMSPGELNIGLGMSYSTSNKAKGTDFGASISPLSYNLKTCLNSSVNETAYGIKEGRKTVSEYGSSAECNFRWKIAYNISYNSRLFFFTDYDYIQSDWEHTINFDINRFLSTQLYVHFRYDSSTQKMEDTNWHKFQLKEILSFGFNYRFSTI